MMQIPEPVRVVLKSAGLSGRDWHRLREAFEAVPDSGTVSEESILRLADAARHLAQAERLRLIAAVPFDLEMGWRALLDHLFRMLWELWGHEGPVPFAKRMRMARTTVYRRLDELQLPIAAPHRPRRAEAQFETVAQVRAEIERLQQQLAQLEACEVEAR